MDAGWRTPPGVSAWHRGKPGRGGPSRPAPGAPRPLRARPLPRAAPPHRRRSAAGPGARGPRFSPAPVSPPEAPAALSILGNDLISLGSGGGFPLLIWRFRPRAGGEQGARAREPGCRRAARPPPGRGSARLLPGQAALGGCPGERPAASRAAAAGRAPAPLPPPFARLALFASPGSAEGPRARRARCGGVLWAPAARPARGLPAPRGLRGISGTPGACRERPAPPALADSAAALPAAPDRGRPRLCALPSRSGERGTAKTGALGTARPQPPLTWPRRQTATLGTLLSLPEGRPLAQRLLACPPPPPQARALP